MSAQIRTFTTDSAEETIRRRDSLYETFVINTVAPPTPSEGHLYRYVMQGTGQDSYDKLVMHFELPLADTSFSPHTVSFARTAIIDSTVCKFGTSSLLLDGASWIDVSSNTDFDFGTDDFTIEAWIYFNGVLPSGKQTIYSQLHTIDGRDASFVELSILPTALPVPIVSMSVSDYGVSFNSLSGNINSGLLPNIWYHVKFYKLSNTWYLFFNGIEIAQQVCTDAFPTKGTDWQTAIGANYSISTGPFNFFKGRIDELRVSKGIARTESPPTVPYYPNRLVYKDSTGYETIVRYLI